MDIAGTNGPNNILGTAASAVIHGRGGNGTIDGGEGNDVICGGEGNDELRDGNGDYHLAAGELLCCGTDDNRLYGEAGNDRLFGNNPGFPSGIQLLVGGDGNDCLLEGAE